MSILSLLIVFLFAPRPSICAEIYSNASGGGPWSDSATWKGGVVPGPEDEVVLARDDVVTFDRRDEKQPTCKQLLLDPRAVLQFKQGAGPLVLSVNGLVESYGYIRMDASKAASDRHEFRLVHADIEQRTMKFAKGGGLVVAGRMGLPKGAKNVFIRAVPPAPEKKDVPFDPTAIVEAQTGATLDVQRAEFENIYLQGSYIDNTGAKPGERVNVVRNHFIGTSRLLTTGCDTPLIADNLFERTAEPPLQVPAIYLNGCPLAEVRGNTIRGTYSGGITGYGQTEGSVTDNVIEKCPVGLYWYGANAMIRNLTIKDCTSGMTMTSASGTLENVTFDGCRWAYYHGGASAQFTNLVIKNMQKIPDAYQIYHVSGPLTLVNSDIQPEQITWHPTLPDPPAAGKPPIVPVQSLQYVIANVKGTYPPGIALDLRTLNPVPPLAPNAVDPNVRNSPAPVHSSGFTPFPRTLEPLIVRSWMFDPARALQKAPEYQLRVLAPATASGGERAVLKTLSITPQKEWYRPDANDKKPTVEVTLP